MLQQQQQQQSSWAEARRRTTSEWVDVGCGMLWISFSAAACSTRLLSVRRVPAPAKNDWFTSVLFLAAKLYISQRAAGHTLCVCVCISHVVSPDPLHRRANASRSPRQLLKYTSVANNVLVCFLQQRTHACVCLSSAVLRTNRGVTRNRVN